MIADTIFTSMMVHCNLHWCMPSPIVVESMKSRCHSVTNLRNFNVLMEMTTQNNMLLISLRCVTMQALTMIPWLSSSYVSLMVPRLNGTQTYQQG